MQAAEYKQSNLKEKSSATSWQTQSQQYDHLVQSSQLLLLSNCSELHIQYTFDKQVQYYSCHPPTPDKCYNFNKFTSI